jgi:hypothetical protein
MFDDLLVLFCLLVRLNLDQPHINKYSMLQRKLIQVHLHKHAMPLGLMLLQLVFVVKNVFDVVFVELSKQNQNRVFPGII